MSHSNATEGCCYTWTLPTTTIPWPPAVPSLPMMPDGYSTPWTESQPVAWPYPWTISTGSGTAGSGDVPEPEAEEAGPSLEEQATLVLAVLLKRLLTTDELLFMNTDAPNIGSPVGICRVDGGDRELVLVDRSASFTELVEALYSKLVECRGYRPRPDISR